MGERIRTSFGQTGIIEWTADHPWKARFIPDGGVPVDMDLVSMSRGTTEEAVRMKRRSNYSPPEASRKRWMTYELTSGAYFTYEWLDRPLSPSEPKSKTRAQRNAEQQALYADAMKSRGEG